MARHSKTRRSNTKLFRKIYSPLHHALMATRNVSKGLFSASGAIVNKGLQVVDNTGSAIARHANMAVRNVTSRKNRSASRKANGRKASTRKYNGRK